MTLHQKDTNHYSLAMQSGAFDVGVISQNGSVAPQRTHGTRRMKVPANSPERESARKDCRELLLAAFGKHTQDATAKAASQKIGVSKRTIIHWLQCQHDMPYWAYKATVNYIERIEKFAQKIEGEE